jgi:hypothetical protein
MTVSWEEALVFVLFNLIVVVISARVIFNIFRSKSERRRRLPQE